MPTFQHLTRARCALAAALAGREQAERPAHHERSLDRLRDLFAIYMLVDAVVPTRQQRAACDLVVATLLEARDPVELNRAVALTGLLRCNVARRMRAPE